MALKCQESYRSPAFVNPCGSSTAGDFSYWGSPQASECNHHPECLFLMLPTPCFSPVVLGILIRDVKKRLLGFLLEPLWLLSSLLLLSSAFHLSSKCWLPFSSHLLSHLITKKANQNTVPETAVLWVIFPLLGNHHALGLLYKGFKMTYFLQYSAHLLIFFID